MIMFFFLLSNGNVYQGWLQSTLKTIVGRRDLTRIRNQEVCYYGYVRKERAYFEDLIDDPSIGLEYNVQRIYNFSWFISNDGPLCNGNEFFTTCKIANLRRGDW